MKTIRRSIPLYLCVVLGLAGGAAAVENYMDGSWADSIRIYLNTTSAGAGVDSNVHDFPVLVKLTPDNFAHFPSTQAGGADIRFSKSDHSQHLSYEIERWVDEAGLDMDTAAIWVKLDTVFGGKRQFFWMHFNNPSAADSSNSWAVFDTTDSNFHSVWHLNEDMAGIGNAGVYVDATAAGRHGDDYVSAAADSGLIGGGQRFDGLDDSITVPGFDPNGQGTINFWVNRSSLGTEGLVGNSGGTSSFILAFGAADALNNNLFGTTGVSSGTQFMSTGKWEHVAVTWDHGVQVTQIFVNGQADASGVTVSDPGSFNLKLGTDGTTPFNGILDEVQISKRYRKPEWIKLCYESQKPKSKFAIVQEGLEVVPGEHNPTLTGGATFTGDTVVMLQFKLFGMPPESVLVDSVRIKNTLGDTDFIYEAHLYRDLNWNGTLEPGTDEYRGWSRPNAVYPDSIMTFEGFPLDTLGSGDSIQYLLAYDLDAFYTFSPFDSLQAELSPDGVFGRGITTDSSVLVRGMPFKGGKAYGKIGSLHLGAGPANDSTGGATFTGKDTLAMLQFSLQTTAEESLYVDSIRVKHTLGDTGFIDYASLYRDNNGDGRWDTGDSALATYGTIWFDSTFLLEGGAMPLDSLGPNQTKHYLLTYDLDDFYPLSPSDTLQVGLDSARVYGHGKRSKAPCTGEGPVDQSAGGGGGGGGSVTPDVEGGRLYGSMGGAALSAGPSNVKTGGPAYNEQDNAAVLQFSLQSAPDESLYVDSVRVKNTYGDTGFIEWASLYRDNNADGLHDAGDDTLSRGMTAWFDSTFRFDGGGSPLDSLGPSETAHYLLTYDLDYTPKFAAADSLQAKVQASQLHLSGIQSSAVFAASGDSVYGGCLFGLENRYVNAAATPGGNGTIGAPFDSLPLAFEGLGSGDSVLIAGGEYHKIFDLWVDVDTVSILGGYSSDFSQRDPAVYRTVLDADSADTNAMGMLYVSSMAPKARIDGITFRDAASSCLYFEYANDAVVSNCFFVDSRYGVSTHEAHDVLIANNVFASDSIGALIDYYSTGARIHNNTFHGNQFAAIRCSESDSAEALNNIFSDNGYGIYESWATFDSIRYNTFSNHAIAGYGHYNGASTIDVTAGSMDTLANCANNLTVAPQYGDPTGQPPDFRQKPRSQCIDAGDPASAYVNEPMPNGGRINLGAFGNTKWATSFDTTAPDNDMTLTATAIDTGAVALSWNPSAIDSTDADSVGIWYKTSDFPDSAWDVTTTSLKRHTLSATEDTVTGLNEKTWYYFGLAVRDSAANWSDTAATASASVRTLDKTSPSNVSALSASWTASDSIYLSWTASDSVDAESTVVRYDTSGTYPSSESGGMLWAYFDMASVDGYFTGAQEKTTYRFAAFVRDSSGNWCASDTAARDSASVPDLTAPRNVTALTATPIDNTSIGLTWSAPASADAESVMVRYRADGIFPVDTGSGSLHASLPLSVLSDTLTGLSEKTWYHIGLFVKDSAGLWSSASSAAQDSGYTPDKTPPANISGFDASPAGGDSAYIVWNQSVSTDADSTMIRYRTDGVYPTSRTDGNLWAYYETLTNNDYVTGLTEKTMYHFGGFVRDSSGNWCAADTAAQDSVYIDDYTPPANVTGLSATALDTAGSVGLGWTASTSTDAEELMIRYRAGAPGPSPVDAADGSMWSTLAPSVTADTMTYLTEKTWYYVGVFVRDSAGFYSAATTDARDSVFVPDKTVPDNVSSMTASHVGNDTIQLGWTAPTATDVESVLVRYRIDGSYPTDRTNGTLLGSYLSSTTSAYMTGAAENTEYYFGAFVRDSSGNWSAATAGAQAGVRVPDLTGPANVTSLLAYRIDNGTIGLSWTPSVSGDADSTMIRYRTDGVFPTDTASGTLWTTLPASASVDTLTGLARNTCYHVGLFVRDTSGLWCAATTDSRDSTCTFGTVATPTFSPAQGIYSTSINAFLSTTTSDASLYYTLDGSTPATSSTLYTGAIPIDVSTTIKAIAARPDWVTSAVDSATYTIRAELPYSPSSSMTSVSGTGDSLYVPYDAIDSTVTITMETVAASDMPTGGMVVLDRGFDFGPDGLVFTTPLTLTVPYDPTAVAAAGISESALHGYWYNRTAGAWEGIESKVDTAANVVVLSISHFSTFTVGASVEPPVFSLPGDTYAGPQHVALSCATSGATIYYTTDGSEPTDSSTVYSDTLTLSSSTVLKARAYKSGMAASYVREQSYVIYQPPVAAFGAAPVTGPAPLNVTFTDSSSGDISSRHWDFGDGATGTATSPSHTFTEPGTYSVTLIVSGPAGNDTLKKTELVQAANTPPALTVPTDTTISEDVGWHAACSAADANSDLLAFGLARADTGMTIDSSGIIAWTPGNSDVGTHDVVVECWDARGDTTRDTFTVTVKNINDPPTIAYTGDTVVYEDSAFTAVLAIADIDQGDSVSVTDTVLPIWLALSGDTLRGTPEQKDVGVDTLKIVVADRNGATARLVHALEVVEVNDAPVVVSHGIPDTLYEDRTVEAVVTLTDSDIDDSLEILWPSSKPSWLSVRAFAADTAEWKLTLALTPTQSEVGEQTVSFEVGDRAGASVTVTATTTVVDRNDPPATDILSRKVRFGVARYTVTGTDDRDADSVLTFEQELYDLSDSTKTTIAPAKASGGNVSYYPLVDGTYLFTARAVDGSGLMDSVGAVDTLVISGATNHTFNDTGGWHMVAVPAATLSADSLKNGGKLSHWDEGGQLRAVYEYYIPSAEITSVQAGKAYWRKAGAPAAITLGAADLVDTTVSLTLNNAAYGWNQISSPFPYPVAWDHGSTLWKWDAETKDFEEVRGVLEPWEGYWVMADSTQTVAVAPEPVFEYGGTAKRAKTFFAGRSEWRVQIVFRGKTGRDADNIVGFSRTARNGYDRLDRYEPPRMSETGYLYFPREEWNKSSARFASDVRRRFAEVNAFDIAVAPTAAGTMRFEGASELFGVHLFLGKGAKVTAVDPDKSYQIAQSDQTQYYTLYATSNSDFLKSFPRRFAMENPYPNPCRLSTRIRYTLPYRWEDGGRLVNESYEVKVTIHDSQGRAIRTLAHRPQAPGSYTVAWDGKSQSGHVVSAGSYFCRIAAGEYEVMKRVVMIR